MDPLLPHKTKGYCTSTSVNQLIATSSRVTGVGVEAS